VAAAGFDVANRLSGPAARHPAWQRRRCSARVSSPPSRRRRTTPRRGRRPVPPRSRGPPADDDRCR